MGSVRKKLVIVGDGYQVIINQSRLLKIQIVYFILSACGKTCLLFAFSRDQFYEEYETTVFETYVSNIVVENAKVIFYFYFLVIGKNY